MAYFHRRPHVKNSTTQASGSGRLKAHFPLGRAETGGTPVLLRPDAGRMPALRRSILAFGIDDPRGVPATDTAVADNHATVIDCLGLRQRPAQTGGRLAAIECNGVQVNHSAISRFIQKGAIGQTLILRPANRLIQAVHSVSLTVPIKPAHAGQGWHFVFWMAVQSRAVNRYQKSPVITFRCLRPTYGPARVVHLPSPALRTAERAEVVKNSIEWVKEERVRLSTRDEFSSASEMTTVGNGGRHSPISGRCPKVNSCIPCIS